MTAYTHLNVTTNTITTLTDPFAYITYGDGSIEFTDVDGNVVNAHSNDALQRFAAALLADKAS